VTDDREPNGPPTTNDEPEDAAESVAELDAEAMRSSIGAYVLDALSEDERASFEAFLDTSPETQDELRQLAPVVTLLPQLLELERPGDAAAPAPSAELRERIMTGAATGEVDVESIEAPARDETQDAEAPVAPARTIRTPPPDSGPVESKQRSRPAPARDRAARTTPSPLANVRQFPTSWLIAAGLAVVAVGAIIWALALLGRIDNKEREITAQHERLVAQDAEIDDLRNNANATAFTLSATGEETPGAGGTLLFSPKDQIGVLYVHDLPPLDEERVYQLWYLDDQSAAPRPGGTFTVDSNGNGFTTVEADTPTFDQIALTEEPQGGSDAPTSEIVLAGQLGGAAG
jgi:hypothetical protein